MGWAGASENAAGVQPWQRSGFMSAIGTASFNVEASVRGSPIRWLVLGGIVLIAAIMIGTMMMANNFRERALNNRERELDNTVLLLARHFDQEFEDFELIQQEVVAQIQSARFPSADLFRDRMSS